jgi:hypothetical protein
MLPFVDTQNIRNIDLALELRLADDALTGRVRTAGGGVTDFSGWLGLVATIEALLADAHGDGATEAAA